MMGSETTVETMSDTPDSLLDQDDVAYPCKGCGEVSLDPAVCDVAAQG